MVFEAEHGEHLRGHLEHNTERDSEETTCTHTHTGTEGACWAQSGRSGEQSL
jgi:hypothetical protein